MKEPTIILRFNADLHVLVSNPLERTGETYVANITSEGFKFLTAWEADSGWEVPTLGAANLQALAQSLPAIQAVIQLAETQLLEIQLRLNEGRRVAQAEVDALNDAYLHRHP